MLLRCYDIDAAAVEMLPCLLPPPLATPIYDAVTLRHC